MAAAGVPPGCDPVGAWRLLRDREGRRATVLDLYELVARPRGLAGHQLPGAERAALARAVMPLIWPGFSITEGSERADNSLQVVDYDRSWPAYYRRWQESLAGELGAVGIRIEHVGSTSIPDLPAKPTIDIQVSVADLRDESAYLAAVQRVGLQLRSRDELHRFFRPPSDQPRAVHVHVCTTGSDWEREHLLFRDYLRSHPGDRDAYAQLKRTAARTWSDDRTAYTDAKTEIILGILDAAESWARDVEWTV